MSSFLPVPDPVAFSVFGLDIMWYAVMITAGMVIGAFIAYKRAPHRTLSADHLLDYVLYCVPAGIVGARIYYVVFEWGYYRDNPGEILNFRGGGLAIHGGLIFAFILLYILTKKHGQSMFDWMDLILPSISFGQAVGRWGNYFNSEAHGTPTDLPWAIECDGQLVHPTFLYESVWCFLLFIFLILVDEKHIKNGGGFKGQITALYCMLYSVERYFVEGLRTDSLYLDAARTIRQAQVISAGIFVLGLVIYLVMKKKGRPILNVLKSEGEELPEA